MKTTFDLPPSLLERAKKLAAKRKTTVKELVILGLRTVISESAIDVRPFKLEPASVKGKGLQAVVRHLSPAELIELSYQKNVS